ncbi:eukaryotic translation initiation factor 2 subunit gamma [Pestalotiopsis sp. IQ-011]
MAASMQRLLRRQASKAAFSSVCSSAGRVQAQRASFASSALNRATTSRSSVSKTTTTTAAAARRAYSTEPPKGSNNSIKFWPFLVIIALGTGGYAMVVNQRAEMPADAQIPAPAKSTPTLSGDDVTVVFVLGGPGAGKGTQCANLVKDYGFTHLSAGDLLRAEQERPGSQFGDLIKDYIKNGLIVPMEVTVQLLENAMVADLDRSGKGEIRGRRGKFLIDGFPRKLDQAHKFEESVCPAKMVLFYDCSEAEMEKRLLIRGQTSGRSDDNADSIRKRFRTFVDTSMPVVDYYETQSKVVKINAERDPEVVHKDTQKQVESRLGKDF